MTDHPIEAEGMPAVYRYAVAYHDLRRAQESFERARRVIEIAAPEALTELRAKVPARRIVRARLLNDYTIELFYDEAGLVVL